MPQPADQMLQLMVDDIFMTVAAEDRVLEFSDLNQTMQGAQKVMASRRGLML
ncbi:MAG: hypothetical protein WAL98_10725 [Desulfatiglandaceae bacterium]